MITELEIEGFKSFGYPAAKIQLGRLNFMAGANASGKSNLILALQFIQNAVLQNVEYAVNELGGNAEVRNKIYRERTKPRPVRFRLKFDDSLEFAVAKNETLRVMNLEYGAQIDLRSEQDIPKIVSEHFVARVEREGQAPIRFQLNRDRESIEITDIFHDSQIRRTPVLKEESARLAVGSGGFLALPCVPLLENIKKWRFYNISPDIARRSYPDIPETELGRSGENLSVILHKMKEGKNGSQIKKILHGLKSAVPGFREIKTTRLPVENKWAFQIGEEKMQGSINPASVSDGTIRLLALLVIAYWTARKSSLIALEEPENGLHPHLAEHIIEVLREAAAHSQLLVTTHSPAFLDHLDSNEVILFDKIGGKTRLKRAADVQEIDIFRKHYSIGDLWIQGTLGGIP